MHPIHPLKSHANNALLAILLGNSAGSKPAEQARKIFQQFGSWQKIFQSTAEQWNQAGFETITWQQIQACDEMNHRYLLESLKKTKLSPFIKSSEYKGKSISYNFKFESKNFKSQVDVQLDNFEQRR